MELSLLVMLFILLLLSFGPFHTVSQRVKSSFLGYKWRTDNDEDTRGQQDSLYRPSYPPYMPTYPDYPPFDPIPCYPRGYRYIIHL